MISRTRSLGIIGSRSAASGGAVDVAIPQGWVYVELLVCPWCRFAHRRAILERTDNRRPWACACGFWSEGRHFDAAALRRVIDGTAGERRNP